MLLWPEQESADMDEVWVCDYCEDVLVERDDYLYCPTCEPDATEHGGDWYV